MPRKLLVLALTIAALQACDIVFLGTSSIGSFLGNVLQLVASGLAAAMCFGAARRGHGLSRPFWLLVGMSMACWGVANLGWMYYEDWLHLEPPRLSPVRILFEIQGVFFAAALFLDKHKDSPRFDAETLLDSLQVGIVFFQLGVGEMVGGRFPGKFRLEVGALMQKLPVFLVAIGLEPDEHLVLPRRATRPLARTGA